MAHEICFDYDRSFLFRSVLKARGSVQNLQNYSIVLQSVNFEVIQYINLCGKAVNLKVVFTQRVVYKGQIVEVENEFVR